VPSPLCGCGRLLSDKSPSFLGLPLPGDSLHDGITSHGVMAQLVARLHGMQKARGSSPRNSTLWEMQVRILPSGSRPKVRRRRKGKAPTGPGG
jgi:hypothetical protein